jgi:head-tail adaptor
MTWPTLDAGEMRHQVNILGQVPATDVSGSTVAMVPVLVGVWAKIEIVRGLDVIKSGQETTQTFLIISIFWQEGIAANMQVQALNGLYLIQSIENVANMDVVLKLNCLAVGKNSA